MKKHSTIAIVYDFDGTLAPGNIQERAFIPAIGIKDTKKFWQKVSIEAKKHAADEILMYMQLMLKKANENDIQIRKKDFELFGKDIPFFKGILPENGVKGWFDRINEYGKTSKITIEHYVISSGIKEMITGTPIKKEFKTIFASSFRYDQHDVANWPALAINYTTKTQYLFRINKGCLTVSEKALINTYTPDEERKIPFSNIIYIGDGDTDIPCFRVVKDRGGFPIAVYKPNTKGAKEKALKLKEEGRIEFSAPADYRQKSDMERIVQAIIDKIQIDSHLNLLKNLN